MGVLGETFRRRQVRQRHGLEQSQPLATLLISYHALRTSNARDKVNSLLGLAFDENLLDVPVDYSSSVEAIYTTAAARIVRRHQSVDLLLGNLGDKAYNLPSWVPGWSTWRFGTGCMIFDAYHAASGQTKPELHVAGNALNAAGCIFDKVFELSDCVGPRFSESDKATGRFLPTISPNQNLVAGLKTVEWLGVQLDAIAQLGQYPKDPESQLEVLWRTLINNTTFQEIPAEEEHFSYFYAYFASCARWNQTTLHFFK